MSTATNDAVDKSHITVNSKLNSIHAQVTNNKKRQDLTVCQSVNLPSLLLQKYISHKTEPLMGFVVHLIQQNCSV